MFDTSLLIAAGASFVAGLIGYIIARLWIKPIVRYTVTKRKVNRELTRYLELMEILNDDNIPIKPSKEGRRYLKNARTNAMNLTSCYAKEIPYWYRLLLDSRRESPADASGLLTNLSKIQDGRQVKDRIVRAQQTLGIK